MLIMDIGDNFEMLVTDLTSLVIGVVHHNTKDVTNFKSPTDHPMVPTCHKFILGIKSLKQVLIDAL